MTWYLSGLTFGTFGSKKKCNEAAAAWDSARSIFVVNFYSAQFTVAVARWLQGKKMNLLPRRCDVYYAKNQGGQMFYCLLMALIPEISTKNISATIGLHSQR